MSELIIASAAEFLQGEFAIDAPALKHPIFPDVLSVPCRPAR